MDEVFVPAPRTVSPARAEAYADLPLAVLITDLTGIVIFANGNAMDLFVPLQPVGFALRTLLGLSGVTGSGDLVRAVEANTPSEPVRIGLPNGRILDGRSRPLSDGAALLTLFDITDYVQSAELNVSDALTGLATRAGFHQRLEQVLADHTLADNPVAVLYTDLDKFKMINDTLGHPVGDALLVKVAERLRSAVRAGDMIARLGRTSDWPIQ